MSIFHLPRAAFDLSSVVFSDILPPRPHLGALLSARWDAGWKGNEGRYILSYVIFRDQESLKLYHTKTKKSTLQGLTFSRDFLIFYACFIGVSSYLSLPPKIFLTMMTISKIIIANKT